MKKILFSFALLIINVASGTAQETRLTGESQDTYEQRMQWFADAKLGIFIHWGIYAVRGVSESWSFYNNYLPYDEYMQQTKGFSAS